MSSRHPARLAVYAAGEVFYPRELAEVDGKLYIIDEDGTSRILNDYKITTLQDGDGVNIDTIHPTTQKTIKMPNASESVRGMVKLGSTAPKAATDTASKGSSTAVSREDHTHPKQTDISGNAETATKFKDSTEIELTGDVTGTASSTGGWSIATTLKSSGVTAGSYGPSANETPDHEESFIVPQITVDAKGRVIEASNKTITIPSKSKEIFEATLNPGSAYQAGTDSPFIYTLAISGMLSTYIPMVDLVLSDDYSKAQEELSEFGKIYSIETHDGSVTISATDELNTSLPLTLKFVCIISPKSIENFIVSMPTSDWTGSNAPYSKTIAVNGIFESDTPIVDLILPDDYGTAQDQLIEFNKVYKIDVVDSSITLYATEVPTAEVTMKLMCIR